MNSKRRRVALTALCVLAVVFAASLFPATGFGSYPTSAGDDGRADGSSESYANPFYSPGSGSFDSDLPDEQETVTESKDSTTTETDESSDSSSDEDGETTTAGGSQSSENDPARGLDVLESITAVLSVLGVLTAFFVGIGFRRGTFEIGGSGLIPITISGEPISAFVSGIPARTMSLVIGFSASVPRFVDDTATLLSEFGSGLSVALTGFGSAVGKTATAIGRGFGGAFLALGSVGSGLLSVPSLFSRPNLPEFGSKTSKKEPESTETESDTATAEPEKVGPPDIEEAWENMTEHLRVRNRRAATPEEFARTAINRGFPTDAVRQLTDAFREVRYGSYPSSGERTTIARAALDKIERFRDGDDA
ncbi:DUF4129 domain-containing protein [Haladaptatus cibarius]|uniref:DUF4129 domain-containing protein n=1 Tax=Haladaptatus cibarius TaxID=453847 RepID=UPI000678D56D|nr:DUF4129 domain-containing protein [Haladaptatus cibarius]